MKIFGKIPALVVPALTMATLAAAAEAGIDVVNAAESGLVEYNRLVDISKV